jgi:putative transposase
VENSHQPTRQLERTTRRFKSVGPAQRFLERFGPSREHFFPLRHHRSRSEQCAVPGALHANWREARGVAAERTCVARAGEHALPRPITSPVLFT